MSVCLRYQNNTLWSKASEVIIGQLFKIFSLLKVIELRYEPHNCCHSTLSSVFNSVTYFSCVVTDGGASGNQCDSNGATPDITAGPTSRPTPSTVSVISAFYCKNMDLSVDAQKWKKVFHFRTWCYTICYLQEFGLDSGRSGSNEAILPPPRPP